MGFRFGGDCGGVINIGSEDTMPTEIAEEMIDYGNALLHENVEPRKLQIFFPAFHIHSICKAGGYTTFPLVYPLFTCSWPGLEFIDVSVGCQFN